jgi:hypothetical protein
MSESRTYARIWLHVVREGGWHASREIFDAVTVDAANPSSVLGQMLEAGYLVRRQGQKGKYEYAVMPSCRLPRTLSVGELTEALTT